MGASHKGIFLAVTALLLAACDDVVQAPNAAAADAIARGRDAAERLGCGACHAIPGVWPRGTTGPALDDFGQRGLIAGKLPNRPDALAAFLLDSSGTAMPTVPMTRTEAADIAAFLQQTDVR